MDQKFKIFLRNNLGEKFSGSFLFQTTFSILFPKYQEIYIREVWSIVQRILCSVKLGVKLNTSFGCIEVFTTLTTEDPFVIFKAKSFLKLLARSVPVDQATKIFDNDISCDIIKISNIISNRKKFLKRRRRLIGNDGLIVRAIELATQSYILVQGNTISCMGKFGNLKKARRVIESCMFNIHPIIHIKSLLIKDELLKDERFNKISWNRFLPLVNNRKKKMRVGVQSLERLDNLKTFKSSPKKTLFIEKKSFTGIPDFKAQKKENLFLNKYTI